jgi:hypothetical protein
MSNFRLLLKVASTAFSGQNPLKGINLELGDEVVTLVEDARAQSIASLEISSYRRSVNVVLLRRSHEDLAGSGGL